jgi:multiple sugar transport system ATP-binding protein
MAAVSFIDATRVFPGSDRPAVDRLSLDVEDGECLVLVGPSGCGKTTSLRMLAGLEAVDEGSISIDGRDITELAPRDRDIAMVFQSYALYPHMTVAENMGFALKIGKVPKAEAAARVRDAARLLELDPYLDRKPAALSGGQRQRVAMGRAIVRQPRVFLMDEPLSNLDAKLRVATRAQIASLQRRLAVTTLYVTHDQVEAMTMGDRVAVMKDGVLQQCDTPRTLYDNPANAFVAGFIGSPPMNLVPGRVVEAGVKVEGATLPVERGVREAASGQEVLVGIRPEALSTRDDGNGFPAIVTLVEELGSEVLVYATIGDREHSGSNVVLRTNSRSAPRLGDVVHLRVEPDAALLFDRANGTRIS